MKYSMRRRRQSGQAIILTIVAVGILLLGAMGLAIDAGQMYGTAADGSGWRRMQPPRRQF